MKTLNKPFLLSILSGLFLAFNFYMFFFYYLSPEFEWKSLGYQLKNYAENGLLFFTIGFIISTFFSLAIGFPLYLLAKHYSYVNYTTSGVGGMTVTITPYVVCVFLGWNVPNMAETSGLIVIFVLAICGGASGILFHFLNKIGKPAAND
ncbi:hypothetical protein ENC22_23605 [Hahella sp. KA22]|nr:hypothetical protein ENC22_23605 [Hahella sp. KA22]